MQINQTRPANIAVTMGMQAYMQQTLHSEPVRQVNIPVSVSGEEDGAAEHPLSDRVTLSPEALDVAQKAAEKSDQTSNGSSNLQNADAALSAEEQQVVQELKARDAEVRAHEQAHLSQAGKYAAGGISLSFQKGPDGRRYAVGGEVPISLSEESTPEETVTKMETVQKAAMAPANPSAADRQIAAQAAMKATRARAELQQERAEESEELLSSAVSDNSDVPGDAAVTDSDTPPASTEYQPLDLIA